MVRCSCSLYCRRFWDPYCLNSTREVTIPRPCQFLKRWSAVRWEPFRLIGRVITSSWRWGHSGSPKRRQVS